MDTKPGDRRDRWGESWATQRAGGAVKLERCQKLSGAWCHPLSHFLESFSNIHIFPAVSNQVTFPLAHGEEGRVAQRPVVCVAHCLTAGVVGAQGTQRRLPFLAPRSPHRGSLC